jgi:predicted AlkP superfamily pyrophosphatase or phosphodiesterase
MRNYLLSAAALLAACGSPPAVKAQATSAPAAPKLLIVLSVDQFSADLFDRYRPTFTAGLGRLANGTVFANGYQGHAATETCPGHSTILTGSFPYRTGIIANNWYDLRQTRSDKSVYCAEDERVAGSSSASYTVSPRHLKTPTLGELLKAQSPASISVSVAGKDRAAIMMGGQRPDQRWYWDGSKFTTDLKGVAVPRTIGLTNVAVSAAIAAPRPPLQSPADCLPRTQAVALEGGGKPVGTGNFARAGGDARAFRATPEFDGAVLAMAAGLIQELKLGADNIPDVIAVGLSATDYVGHTYGTNGLEMCLQLHSLDRDLGDFFRLLDNSRIDYAVALTADHGGEDVPERLRQQGVADAARVQKELSATEVGKRVAGELRLSGPVLYGDFFGDVYVDTALNPQERRRAVQRAVAIYSAHPQVEAVFTREQIARTAVPRTSPDKWTLIERVRASFDPERSGDFYVILKRHITPIPDTRYYAATHGSVWDYDRRVPILFWRPGMAPSNQGQAINTADIMPTLAAMLGVRLDAAKIDGHCLSAVAGVSCPR